MKYIKTINELRKLKLINPKKPRKDTFIDKLRKDLLLFNLDWNELLLFLKDRRFDISKLDYLNNYSPTFLNKGAGGIVYDIGNNKVVKITTDNTDYQLARKLIDKKLLHLPTVYDINVISNKSTSLFLIVMEKCEILTDDYQKFIKSYLYEISAYLRTNNTSYLRSNNFIEEYRDFFEKNDLKNQFISLRYEIMKCGININRLDIHINNFLLKDGKLCFIDLIKHKRHK